MAPVSCVFRVSTAVDAVSDAVVLGASAVHIFAEVIVKPEENAVIENAQIEVPGQGGVGGG